MLTKFLVPSPGTEMISFNPLKSAMVQSSPLSGEEVKALRCDLIASGCWGCRAFSLNLLSFL